MLEIDLTSRRLFFTLPNKRRYASGFLVLFYRLHVVLVHNDIQACLDFHHFPFI